LPTPDDLPIGGLSGWDVCATYGHVQDLAEVFFTVVLCTKDRPDELRRALSTLLHLEYGAFEVLVVDNAPSTSASRECVEEFAATDRRIRYVVEERTGLSRARNTGLAAALYDWVAFVDDDVLVDPWWLRALASAVVRSRAIGCVTGLVPPASLVEPAQRYFDERVSWTSSLAPRVYDLDEHQGDNALYPYLAGIFGTGANFAVDRRLMRAIGGFDTALGAGSRSKGGEDLDIFLRVLLAGRAIAYEPSAVIWHVHRSDSEALGRQMYAYGLGLTAFLAKHVLSPRTGLQVLRRVPRGLVRMLQLWSRSSASHSRENARYRRAEMRGMIVGPLAYLQARRSERAVPTQRL
jgi:GT2 family glycosyltransferase